MTSENLDNIWNYFLVLVDDIEKTARYVDPSQKDVFSFEYLKIINLTCVEIENVLQLLCNSLTESNSPAGNIGEYKNIILTHIPQITTAEVYLWNEQKSYRPFDQWNLSPLPWWKEYQALKHHRLQAFTHATLWNASCCLAALYILILYLTRVNNHPSRSLTSPFISSNYSPHPFVVREPDFLPGFECDA